MQTRAWRWCANMVIVVALAGSSSFQVVVAQEASATPEIDFAALSGEIVADGSSTVWPMTDEAALRFTEEAEGVEATVGLSGTGGGFRKFCDGETDLQSASRAIGPDEMKTCAENAVSYFAFEVAYDGITVVVNPDIEFVSCLTVNQLRLLWQPESPAKRWSDLDPAWPNHEIELYGPGPDSGTFDYFTSVIVGEEGASRADYIPSENDLDLVEGVATDDDALGYFGFSYFEGARDRLRPVAIDSGNGCVLPSAQTIGDGSYAPLSRPLYVYVNAESLKRTEVAAFMRFYLSNAQSIAVDTGFVPSPTAVYEEDRVRLDAAILGTAPPDGPASSGE